MADSDYQTDVISNLILDAKRVVVSTGAGVSTESGIPDFRSPGGIWDKYDPEEFTIQKFLSSPEARRAHWKMLTKTASLWKLNRILPITLSPSPTG